MTATDTKAFLRGVSSKHHVVINVETGFRSDKDKKRPAFSLAIVLDRSGSMSGEKIQAAKESIKKVIDALQPDDDVSLIVFDDKLDVVFRHGDLSNRQKLKDLVDSVRPSGSTHLSGGLACGALSLGCKPFEVGFFQASAAPGFEFLADIPEKDFPNNSSKRIFLFSDGAANKGVTKQEELAQLASDICEAGAATSTFGIGRDFSEATMTAISRSGHGNFTYIKKAKLIDTYVTEAFSNLTRLIGTSGKLTLRGVGPCLVKKIYDHPGGNVASIKDLREQNKVQVVVEIEVGATDSNVKDRANVLEYELSFVCAETGKTIVQNGSVQADFTSDANVASEVNPAAFAAVLQLQSGEMDLEITALLDANKRDAAIAKKKEIIVMLERAAELDPSGFAPIMLLAARKTLKQLESKRSANKVKKAVQYGGYLQRRASISAMDQLQGYVVEEDSSSEEEQPAAGASYSLAIDSDSDDEEAKKKQIQRRDSITRLRRLS